MGIQAQWNDEIFGLTTKTMRHLDSFEISCGIMTEEKKNANGANITIVKGLAPEEIKISYTAGYAVGCDPRQEFNDFKKYAQKAKAAPFFLGNKNIGAGKFKIESVDLGDTTFNNTGRILAGKISLELKQDPSAK
ncbi:MAG: phage tail protein [Clostridia bacterium]|nr:phage tail protein [Clostridia bacterium]